MFKKHKTKFLAFVSLFLCILTVVNTSSFAVNSQPDDVVEDISVYKRSGVVEGETIQLKASVKASSAVFDAVEWSSSNPDVISCTKDGKIEGLKAGKKATITCRAKYGSKKESMTVYCVEKIPEKVKVSSKYILIFTSPRPGPGIKDIWLDLFDYTEILMKAFGMLAGSMKNYTGSKVTACGRIDNYVYIRYGESNSQDGFVKYSNINEEIDGFLSVTPTDMNVWANGVVNEEKKVTADADGVKWEYDDEYIDFDKKTGQVTGLKPGVTTITAKADGMTAKCTVHLLYKWPQEWVTETNKATSLHKAIGDGFESRKDLAKGTKVTVYGDSGMSDGWAFACYAEGEKEWWGHIPIADVSTKNTISYYNNLNWGYPLKNKDYNYINSPYAPRPNLNDKHRGFDINEKEDQSDIEGQAIVAPFDGIVKRVDADLNTTNGCGYYICITSKTIDPVTGKNLIAIFQHMKSPALFSETDTVKKGQTIGYVGDTGRSNGSHLHFEVNNWNAHIGESGRSDFTYTINPIYFYLDMVKNKELILNMDCSAVNSGYSFYFYNYNSDEM